MLNVNQPTVQKTVKPYGPISWCAVKTDFSYIHFITSDPHLLGSMVTHL